MTLIPSGFPSRPASGREGPLHGLGFPQGVLHSPPASPHPPRCAPMRHLLRQTHRTPHWVRPTHPMPHWGATRTPPRPPPPAPQTAHFHRPTAADAPTAEAPLLPAADALNDRCASRSPQRCTSRSRSRRTERSSHPAAPAAGAPNGQRTQPLPAADALKHRGTQPLPRTPIRSLPAVRGCLSRHLSRLDKHPRTVSTIKLRGAPRNHHGNVAARRRAAAQTPNQPPSTGSSHLRPYRVTSPSPAVSLHTGWSWS